MMDTLTFVAEIIKAVAWPAAMVIIAVVFRARIDDLLARIRKGKVGPAEFEFEERVRELESEARALELPPLSTKELAGDAFVEPDSARATVMGAWLQLENAVESLAKKHKLFNALVPPGSPYNITVLRKAGVVPPDFVSLYRDLRSLRNQAAHELAFQVSPAAVQSYVRTTKELEAAIRRLVDAA